VPHDRFDGSLAPIGRVGSAPTYVPSKAQHVVAVARIAQSGGSVVLACSSQPRFSTMALDGRRSGDLTLRLVVEVTNLASEPTA
jgi:hypothetical protein